MQIDFCIRANRFSPKIILSVEIREAKIIIFYPAEFIINLKRKSICTDLKIYLYGLPTFPRLRKYLALPNPHSKSDNVFPSAFAPPTTSSTAHSLPGNVFHSAWNRNHHVASLFQLPLRQRFN